MFLYKIHLRIRIQSPLQFFLMLLYLERFVRLTELPKSCKIGGERPSGPLQSE